jgi:hypothetical protein
MPSRLAFVGAAHPPGSPAVGTANAGWGRITPEPKVEEGDCYERAQFRLSREPQSRFCARCPGRKPLGDATGNQCRKLGCLRMVRDVL